MKRSGVAAVLMVLILAGACSSQGPMFQAQVCLGDAENVAAFSELLESLANDNGLRFIDSSDRAYGSLKSLGQIPGVDFPIPVTHLGISGFNGGWLTASNIGLTPYEVGIGITPGRDKLKAERLASHLLNELEARWTVELVPLDRGMSPNLDCSAPTHLPT